MSSLLAEGHSRAWFTADLMHQKRIGDNGKLHRLPFCLGTTTSVFSANCGRGRSLAVNKGAGPVGGDLRNPIAWDRFPLVAETWDSSGTTGFC
jgi:hypothetical protein